MKSRNIVKDIMNMIKYEKSIVILGIVICLCLVGPGALRTGYGQGAVETVGTMEIGQEVDNAASRATPARGVINNRRPPAEVNNTTEPSGRAPADMPVKPNPEETPISPDLQERGREATSIETPTVNVDVNDFNAFKQEIIRIDMEARDEDTKWLGKQEKKAELAKAMDDVIIAEFKFLRKVAAAEKDTNTVEAIDLVLEKRRDRLSKLVTKLENEVKEERRQQVGERQPRRAPRTGGAQQQDQTQTERPAGGNSPLRRARGTVNQDQ
jgi:hypothetical protein